MNDTAPGFAQALPRLLLLALALAIGFTAMGSFATVQEAAKAQLHLSDQVLGLVQGVAAAVPLVLLSVPIGIAVDRIHRVRMLIVLALVWTAGTLLTAFAPSAPILFLARMLTAIGTTGALTAALSIGADLCAPAARGRAQLITSLGKMLGTAAGFALTGWLFGQFVSGLVPNTLAGLAPWRSVHLALALLSALLILPLFFLREPPRQEVEAGLHAPFRVVAAELWSRRVFLAPLFAGQISVVMADAAAGIWAAPVLSRNYGVQPQDFAAWMGALILSTGIAGSIIGGLASDWGHKSGIRGGLLLSAVIAAGLGIPAALFPLSPTTPVFAFALGALILCGAVTGIVVSVALTVYIPNEVRGLCIGAFIAIAGLIGFGIAPSLVTWVSAAMGGEAHLAVALAIVGVSVSALSFVAFAAAMRNAPVAEA